MLEALLVAAVAALSSAHPSLAAEPSFIPWPAGVPCSAGAPFWAPPLPTAGDLPWRSVWLGHFSGGRPYLDCCGVKLVDWRDEKVCFPARRACQVWIKEMRRHYHQPEGYWTCLILR